MRGGGEKKYIYILALMQVQQGCKIQDQHIKNKLCFYTLATNYSKKKLRFMQYLHKH